LKTPIASMIADMHSAGIPMEAIISSVATLEEAMAARAVSSGNPVDTSMMEKRRAWDRERKRKQAALRKSGGIPPELSTGIPAETPCIIREKKEEAIQVEVKEKKESKKRDMRARGSRIPPDFSIDDDDRAFAASLGIPPEIVEAETPQFIDYWSSVAGAKGVKLDWKATWRNRMRDLKKYQATRSRMTNGFGPANPRKTGHDALFAAASRKAREIARDGEMAGSADEAEFPFGHDPFGRGSEGGRGSFGRSASGDDGREPIAGGVLEGEVIPPDQDAAGLSGGWRRH
jgi:hypothetical protein